eukprot:TRINITY_DN5906_c0_g1_i1.p1 TRINITY_DN5906_c0_g1~~TRINITY_DN5906_c0_g1_i1.p1  ORF type:complete len:502 (+),score=96.77 TRINITY_DN5906_c0_g1_i1:152-1657(+)
MGGTQTFARPHVGTASRTDRAKPPLIGCGNFRFGSRAGRVGLKNLGNTCFMNAGLQCLCHIEPLAVYFLSGAFAEETNKSNPRGCRGQLANAFADLQKQLWTSDQACQDPRAVHKKLSKFAPHLTEGYMQQDVQEFLAFCLDGLHEDLNRVTDRPPAITEEQEAAQEKLCRERSCEFAAALAWKRHLERDKSFLVDLLQGQLRSTLTCLECGHTSWRFDPCLYMSLPVTRSMSTLHDCFEKYLEEESLTGDERWQCDKCKTKVDAKKKIDLWKLPPVLVLHLKRFEFDNKTFRFSKIDKAISVKGTLDLSEYCSSPQRDGALYDVICVANHSGPFGRGHYTATCRVGNGDQGEFFYFNDERVTPLPSEQAVVGRDAYVIFLARCKQTPSGGRKGGGAAGSRPEDSDGLSDVSETDDGFSWIKRQTVTMPELWPHWLSTRNSVVGSMSFFNPATGEALPSSDAISSSDLEVCGMSTTLPSERNGETFVDNLRDTTHLDYVMI